MSRRTVAPLVLLGLASLAAPVVRPAAAQAPAATVPDGPRGAPVSVYFDCRGGCDFNYVRTEIPHVDWVRDRAVADLHLLIIGERAGEGGTAYTLAFLGQRRFEGMGDTLVYVSTGTSTFDERRRGLTQAIAAGLVRYVARTADLARLRVSLTPAADEGDQPEPPTGRDPWNGWVFRLNANGSLSGEERYKTRSSYPSLSGSRTTPLWKVQVNGGYSYVESKTRVDADPEHGTPAPSVYTIIRRDYGSSMTVVRGIGGHLSLGLDGEVGSDTRRNQRRHARLATALEYDLFPYAQATRRQLTLQYGVGYNSFVYHDTTLYFRLRETLPVHYLALAYETRQPWGAVNFNGRQLAYLSDGSKRSSRINGSFNVRIVRGLSVRAGGSYSLINDQLYLRKGSFSEAEVLLQKYQLRTSYRYDGQFGLTYTFGSIFNGVVNPRFDDGFGF